MARDEDLRRRIELLTIVHASMHVDSFSKALELFRGEFSRRDNTVEDATVLADMVCQLVAWMSERTYGHEVRPCQYLDDAVADYERKLANKYN